MTIDNVEALNVQSLSIYIHSPQEQQKQDMSLINLTVPFQKGCWGKKNPHISLNLQCKKFYNLIFFGQNTVCIVELALHTILLVSINKLLSFFFSFSLKTQRTRL